MNPVELASAPGADLLILCAVGPEGDNLWDRSAQLFRAESEARQRAGLLLWLRVAEVFPTGRIPRSSELIQKYRERLPDGWMRSLHIGVALWPHAEAAQAKLDVLLETFEGVCQVPSKLHLFVIAPDASVRAPPDLVALEEVLNASRGKRVHCRDICWLRGTGGSLDDAAIPSIPDSRIRAATHALWSSQSQAQRPFSLLDALAHPYRDSICWTLFFDRRQWDDYASADVTIRLTGFLDTQPPPDLGHSARAWLEQTSLPSWGPFTPQAHALPIPRVRPGSLLFPPPENAFQSALEALVEQVRRVSDLETQTQQDRIHQIASAKLSEGLTRVASQAPNELQGLTLASQWASSLLAELRQRQETDALLLQTLVPGWMRAANDWIRGLLSAAAVPHLNPDDPASWPTSLADVLRQFGPLLTPPPGQPLTVAECAAAWMSALLPKLVQGNVSPQDLWARISQALSGALASQEQDIRLALEERQAARTELQSDISLNDGGLLGPLFRYLHQRRLRQALRQLDHQCLERIQQRYDEVERLLETGSQWLELAARHQRRLDLERLEYDSLGEAAAPVIRLVAGFAALRSTSERGIESCPPEPGEQADSLSLLSKPELEVLARKIFDDSQAWLEKARQALPENQRDWLSVARACHQILPVWLADHVRDFPVDLPELLVAHFPHLTAPRITRLQELAKAALLPLLHRDASQRRLHQEWHFPAHPRLGSHDAFEVTVTNDVVSTADTSCARFVLADRDRLELHLHVLGFQPQDYLYWNFFAAAAKEDLSTI